MINKKEKIAIVGASIAGSAAAIMFTRAGYEVTVFEQYAKLAMKDRGAGLVLPQALINQYIAEGIFPSDFLSLPITQRDFIVYDPNSKQERLLTSHPINISAVHWGQLYTELPKHLANINTQYETRINTLTQKEIKNFDIVIFADGYDSLGRQLLFPDLKPKYTNYIAWRGTFDSNSSENTQCFLEKVLYYPYKKGHTLFYPIPKINTNDSFLVNWLIYEKIDENCDNIPPTHMSPERIQHLHTLAKEYLPPLPRDIILKTPMPFIQSIYDCLIPHYFAGNIGLIGDASILLRPHAGSGAVKSLSDALRLKEYLTSNTDIFTALTQWGIACQQAAQPLFQLGVSLGELLVTNMPDWNQISKATMDDLLEKSHQSGWWVKPS